MKTTFTLVLNGSPRVGGNGMALAGAFLEALGGAHTRLDLYKRAITPCVACGICHSTGVCLLPDAMPEILDHIAGADVILVASPLHFTSLSAPVIAFFSRLQPFWNGAAQLPPRNRHGILAVTGGSRYPEMFRPARSVSAAAFKTLGVPFHGMITASGTDSVPARENSEALGEARALAASIPNKSV